MAAAALAATLTTSGCRTQKTLQDYRMMTTPGQARQDLALAMESPDADARRRALVRLAKSPRVDKDLYIKALTVIAQTDPSVPTRCVAIRSLPPCEDSIGVVGLLPILNWDSETKDIRQPDAAVLHDTIRSLHLLREAGHITEDQAQGFRAGLLKVVRSHSDRDVRLAACGALGAFKDAEALDKLVDALSDRDFGVNYEAECSLMRLTGRSFAHDPVAWREWLDSAPDPFEQAGQLDGVLAGRRQSWWQRTQRTMREWLTTYAPGDTGGS